MFRKQQAAGSQTLSMGLAWRDLTVTGVSAGYILQRTFGSFLSLPYHLPAIYRNIKDPPVKEILKDFTGCVKPGEMLLVLGRPGSGCTSFLKTMASYREGFREITGDILYEGFKHTQIERTLRGEVVYAPEDDVHFHALTVAQTIDFAVATRTPAAKYRTDLESTEASRASYISLIKEVLLVILGLLKSHKTNVGNDVKRGVSGGERKRVSIAEVLATRALVTCFDNSSRGLDSSTALDFVRCLRVATDVRDLTMLCSLYQAGEQVARIFDKVIVLNEGRTVYFGRFDQAADYFRRLGFEHQPRQTTSDFLVACTDPGGRRVRPGFENRIPKTAKDQAEFFARSTEGFRARSEADKMIYKMRTEQTLERKQSYMSLAQEHKAGFVPRKSRYLTSPFQQVRLAFKRRAQILWADRQATYILTGAAIFQSCVFGSTFYDLPNTTNAFFSRAGILFFSLLYNVFMGVAEISHCYAQRPILIRQKRFAMCSPSADAFANTLLDMPTRLVPITVFLVVIYFMVGLSTTPGQFFVLWGIVTFNTYTMVAYFRTLAAMFRTMSVAMLCSGLTIITTALYTGYTIPRPSMHRWSKWISYCLPMAYSFEIILTNEFRNLKVLCAGMIPSGPSYPNVDVANQVCPIPGGRPGQTIIAGADYLRMTYGYEWDHRFRNVGILAAFFVFYVALYCGLTEFQTDPSAAGGIMVFKRSAEKDAQDMVGQVGQTHKVDTKKNSSGATSALASGPEVPVNVLTQAAQAENVLAQADNVAALETSSDVFTWQNVTYDVTEKDGGIKRILDEVSGFVEPGKLTALMGESGAGKTTLLNVLAQRVDTGVVRGEFNVAGQSLARSFQASTGYCQQQDIHLETTTVREALRFSAVLRQPAQVSLSSKYDYVEQVITLLEMDAWAEAIVGDVGQGLNVEQRKRLTIGVELAAKPKLLVFLDEPTSGLDGQAAWSIVRFLRKLADQGQAVLCTIHQPSGELFNVFDKLLLLQSGGKTVYFGDIGERSNQVIDYFAQRSGRPIRSDENPAEYILDVIGAGATAESRHDWHSLFLESEQRLQLEHDLEQHVHGSHTRPPTWAGLEDGQAQPEFAAKLSVQFKMVLQRTWLYYWRNPTYLVAKMGLCIVAGFFVGASFHNQGSEVSIVSLSNKLFSIFMALMLCTSLSQQMQPQYIRLRDIYEAREQPSKLYSWFVLPSAFLLCEVPWSILMGTLFWLPWYFLVHFKPGDSGSAALSWLYVAVAFQLYWSTFATAIGSMMPNSMLAAILFSTTFSFTIVFAGVLQPPALMPDFWAKWMPLLTPFTYLIEGIMGTALADSVVRCNRDELQQVIPPAGQDCRSYMSAFTSTVDEPLQPGQDLGYYQVESDGACSYCQFRDASIYLERLSAHDLHLTPHHRFRNLYIILGYIIFNIALVFGVFYVTRVLKNKKMYLKKLLRLPWFKIPTIRLRTRQPSPVMVSQESDSQTTWRDILMYMRRPLLLVHGYLQRSRARHQEDPADFLVRARRLAAEAENHPLPPLEGDDVEPAPNQGPFFITVPETGEQVPVSRFQSQSRSSSLPTYSSGDPLTGESQVGLLSDTRSRSSLRSHRQQPLSASPTLPAIPSVAEPYEETQPLRIQRRTVAPVSERRSTGAWDTTIPLSERMTV